MIRIKRGQKPTNRINPLKPKYFFIKQASQMVVRVNKFSELISSEFKNGWVHVQFLDPTVPGPTRILANMIFLFKK